MTDYAATPHRTTPLAEKRLMIKVVVGGLRELKEPVPQQMLDFVAGKVDDPGPLPDPDKYLDLRRTWWQRLLGR